MPRKAARPCAQPGCGALLPRAGRCPAHASEQERARGSRQQRGYDQHHDALRRSWQRRLDAGEQVDCWRCGRRIDPGNWHLGHDDDDRSVYRGPECPPCNLSHGRNAR